MDYGKITKSERRLLRQLAGQAYEAELSRSLEELLGSFQAWRDKRLNAFDVSQKIHEFHDGASRDLYGIYRNMAPEYLVARALVRGLVAESAIGAVLAGKLAPLIETSRRVSIENDVESDADAEEEQGDRAQ